MCRQQITQLYSVTKDGPIQLKFYNNETTHSDEPDLSNRIFQMQIIAGLLEAVSIMLCIFVVLKLGLKINLVIYMVVAGAGCLAVNLLPDGNYFGVITFAMIGKFCRLNMCRVYRKGRHIHATLYSRSHLFMWGYLLYICVDGNTWGFDLDFVSTVQIEWVNCGIGFSHLFSNCMIWLARESYRHSKRYLVVEKDFVNLIFLFVCFFL